MPQLPEFKAADLTRHTGDLFDAAIPLPVAITKHRKPKFVLMSMNPSSRVFPSTRGARRRGCAGTWW